MRRINSLVILALICCFSSSVAQDKKEPRSLAADAAFLAEKGGKNGWGSKNVELKFLGDKKSPGRVLMQFKADKDKLSGKVRLALHYDDMAIALIAITHPFELIEKDGKRFVKLGRHGPLEIQFKADSFEVKGGQHDFWPGWEVNLSKPTTFKAE
jgi:hypothetical protein